MKSFLKTIGMAILAIITITSTINLRAEDTNSNKILSVKGTTGVYNQYLAFASGIPVYTKPVVQSDVLVSHKPTGLYFDLWHSMSFDGKYNGDTLDDEIDFNVGLSRLLGKGWSFDLGVSYFNEPSLSTLGKGDIWWSYVEVDKTFKIAGHEFTGFAKFNAYTPNKGSGFTGNKVIGAGISTQIKLDESVSALFKTSVNHVTPGFGYSSGHTWITHVEARWQFTKRWTMSAPMANVYVPLGWEGMKTDAVIGVSTSFEL